jgi:hypothetical protein
MAEVIDDGMTGFAVAGLEQAVAAVSAAVALDRRVVRATAERRFGVTRMVEEYLAVYRGILAVPRPVGSQ